MLKSLMMVLALAAGSAPPAAGSASSAAGSAPLEEEAAVTLSFMAFPEGFQLDFARPSPFQLFTQPEFSAHTLPDGLGHDPLYGVLPVGPSIGIPFILDKDGKEAFDYTLLHIDSNGNGDFTDDGPPVKGMVKQNYKRITLYAPSIIAFRTGPMPVIPIKPPPGEEDMGRTDAIPLPQPSAVLAVQEGIMGGLSESQKSAMLAEIEKNREDGAASTEVPGEAAAPEVPSEPVPYRLEGALRFSYRAATRTPQTGCFFGRSWMHGLVILDEQRCSLYLLDDDFDCQFTRKDRWALVPISEGNYANLATAFVKVNKPISLGDRAWQLKKASKDGSTVTLKAVPQAAPEPAMESMPLCPELPRMRALEEIPWILTLAQALEQIETRDKPILALLTEPDSPLCRVYLENTFQDAEVVELTHLFIPVHLTGPDVEGVLAQVHVPGFPYLLCFDSKFRLVKRIAGFRTPPQLVKDLKGVFPMVKE